MIAAKARKGGGSHIAIDYESMGLTIICNVLYLGFLYELHPDADISSFQLKRRKEQNERYKCLKCANYCMLLYILCIIAHYIINKTLGRALDPHANGAW